MALEIAAKAKVHCVSEELAVRRAQSLGLIEKDDTFPVQEAGQPQDHVMKEFNVQCDLVM